MSKSFWIETLGCPKNQVDSEKIAGTLLLDGLNPADSPNDANLIVINTCSFIEEAREESIETVFELSQLRDDGAELVVTGCLAERYGDEIASSLKSDVDAVVGFGVPVSITSKPETPKFDLLNLPRPKREEPWGYVKVAEGCDRICGFCAIPSFRGPQRSRSIDDIREEALSLDVQEIVLVAQDLASWGRDRRDSNEGVVDLVKEISELVPWVRLLYLYPSSLTGELLDIIASSPVPYFDLSLQHVSAPLLRKMRRWGDGERFSKIISRIRKLQPEAAFRTNFIVGYPGETEDDHDRLIRFLEENMIDWCGFFPYSKEEGTYAATLNEEVPETLILERVRELGELQDEITQKNRDSLIGSDVRVLVESSGVARSHREAPDIDGLIIVSDNLKVGSFETVTIQEAFGTDLKAEVSPVKL
ncbi:MAG: 30S ribosomal protein S12 methylthiotransferase RimO [Acidimicrobiaceae bacterium]|nr:30S ribosomal protein S12 methylthiotransferase RimO [Acidimicrobiaceae bacterium]